MRAILSDPPSGGLAGPYEAPGCTVRGGARGEIFHPEGYSLWRIAGELDAGTELSWSDRHGDEALYLVNGAVEVDGKTVEGPSAVIVEAGIETTLRAVERTSVLHVGPTSVESPGDGFFGPAESDGRGVHAVPVSEVSRSSSGADRPGARYFSDGTCATCRIAFFVVDCGNPEGFTASSHTHSEDEIIHVLEGQLQVGPLRVEPGMSIAIPGDVRYGFRTPGPFKFVNYRRDISSFVGAPGSERRMELSTGFRPMQVG